MPDAYEREHARNLLAQQKDLTRLYSEAIDRIYVYASNLTLAEGAVFTIADYPQLAAAMDRELFALASKVELTVRNGIEESFALSQRKLGASVNATYYQNRTMPEVMQEIINRPQGQAMESFLNRKLGKEGLGLSERVWKYANTQIRAEIEQNLFAGIAEGKSAREMATLQKRYLQNPDALFRRVRDAKGKLQLSKAAKAFHPGQGVYRSAFKNALRLTVNETNGAYRKADLERYRVTPFITGYSVNLSPSHPKLDICDYLAGEYPLSFEWTSWHPFCLCFLLPIMPDKAEFNRYQEALLRGEGDGFKFSKVVKDVPEAFKDYAAENAERFAGWKSEPYWLRDNKKFVPAAVVR